MRNLIKTHRVVIFLFLCALVSTCFNIPANAQEPQWELDRTLWGHMDAVNSVAFSPDGRYIASGSWVE